MKRLAIFSIVLAMLGCAADNEQALTVAGPEATDIVPKVQGHIVWSLSRGEITALSLPQMQERMVRKGAADDAAFFPTIHALSGPDTQGRIAYIEDHFFVPNENGKKHLLKSIRIDGTRDTEVFERNGSAMWAATAAGGGEIGTHLALAPSGGKVAFLSGLRARQMPNALLHVGAIEVWDLARKVRRKATATAVNEPMSWFPDGNRLVYIALTPRDELPQGAIGHEDLQGYVKSWDAVPAAYELDCATGGSTFLHLGSFPIVSLDGSTLIIGGRSPTSTLVWSAFDGETHDSKRVQWPGGSQALIAAPLPDLALTWGLPTAGTPIKHTQNNSPLRGPKLMLSIKVADADSTRFQTVMPYVDPRTKVSFGQTAEKQ